LRLGPLVCPVRLLLLLAPEAMWWCGGRVLARRAPRW